jgi:hypothetical protein
VPPEAQVHLINAQRELLLAMSVTLQHHLRQRRADEGGGGAAGRRSRRPVRVELE